MEIPKMKFKVQRYTLEEGEIEADNQADASLLLRYGHGPMSWKQIGNPTLKLMVDDKKVIQIDNNNKS